MEKNPHAAGRQRFLVVASGVSETPDSRDPAGNPVGRFLSAQKREAKHVLGELLAMRGLMPLLMKTRNGGHWTTAEKAELLTQLRRLSRISPYLLFLLLPGSALLLPIYAWWLDRRRHARAAEDGQASVPRASVPHNSVPDSQRP